MKTKYLLIFEIAENTHLLVLNFKISMKQMIFAQYESGLHYESCLISCI